jgi:Bacteriocin-protection, YdeI or OmpD-Associated
VPVPFDPNVIWGTKLSHHVAGTINGSRFRGGIEASGPGFAVVLGPTWARDCHIADGDELAVVMEPEGPQRDDLAEDLAAALAADPAAGAFFDSLAQFYRKGYLRYIDATVRRPEVRVARIAEVVALLAAGEKQRPSRTGD